MKPIYLDNNATTAVASEVREAMLPWLGEACGNPSSLHFLGSRAADALGAARGQVARLLGATPPEIVFTSGGTESDQTALAAAVSAGQRPDRARRRVVTSAAEHSAVLEPAAALERGGYTVERVGVDSEGRLDVARLLELVDDDCAAVSLLWANNETGVVQDVEVVGRACRERGVPFHVDGVQAAGKLPVRLRELPIDLFSVSAHKLHGPKGVGALYVRRGFELEPLIRGGPQERERRGGTENVPGLVGFGRAAELAAAWLADPVGPARVAELRDQLERELLRRIPGVVVHGAGAERVANTSNLRIEGLSGEALVMLASDQGLCLSTGAACSSGRQRPSHVLLALGLDEEQASSSLRLSLSRYTSPAEIERALEVLVEAAAQLRALAPSPAC